MYNVVRVSISIHLLANMLLVTAAHFNQVLPLWCAFGLFVIICRHFSTFSWFLM